MTGQQTKRRSRNEAGESRAADGRLRVLPLLIALLLPGGPIRAQGPAPHALAGATLEDLMKIDVTSVSRKEQSLSKTGAAVFVISQEDIRRSGATRIPDLLRDGSRSGSRPHQREPVGHQYPRL